MYILLDVRGLVSMLSFLCMYIQTKVIITMRCLAGFDLERSTKKECNSGMYRQKNR